MEGIERGIKIKGEKWEWIGKDIKEEWKWNKLRIVKEKGDKEKDR